MQCAEYRVSSGALYMRVLCCCGALRAETEPTMPFDVHAIAPPLFYDFCYVYASATQKMRLSPFHDTRKPSSDAIR